MIAIPTMGAVAAGMVWYRKDWADGSLADQTLYGSGAAQSVNGSGQFVLTSPANTEAKSKLGAARLADFDVVYNLIANANVYKSFVYRTTYWSGTNDTYGYILDLSGAGPISIVRGPNSASPTWATVASASSGLTAGALAKIRLRVKGTRHQVWVNDVLKIDATDSGWTGAGDFGFRVYNGVGGGIFDDVVIMQA